MECFSRQIKAVDFAKSSGAHFSRKRWKFVRIIASVELWIRSWHIFFLFHPMPTQVKCSLLGKCTTLSWSYFLYKQGIAPLFEHGWLNLCSCNTFSIFCWIKWRLWRFEDLVDVNAAINRRDIWLSYCSFLTSFADLISSLKILYGLLSKHLKY